jgi:hypothetical protein
VVALLGSPATKKYLRQFDDGSKLAALSGRELLDLFEAELDVVEPAMGYKFIVLQAALVYTDNP